MLNVQLSSRHRSCVLLLLYALCLMHNFSLSIGDRREQKSTCTICSRKRLALLSKRSLGSLVLLIMSKAAMHALTRGGASEFEKM